MEQTEGLAETLAREVTSVSRKTKVILLAGLAVAIAVFWFLSRQFRVPVEPGLTGSLLAGSSSTAIGLVVIAVGLFASVALSTMIVGRVRFDAGLFCGVAGMSLISMRSGRLGDMLRTTPPTVGTSAFVMLAVELVVLYAMVAVAWSALWSLHRGGRLNADEFRDGVEDTDEPALFKALAMLMQVGVMGLIVLLLAQTDNKAQVIAAVGIGGFIGAWAAYYMYPISPSPWLWVGPMIVGVAGYLLAYFNVPQSDDAWRTGVLAYPFAPLARPLPIDYATAGPAGALLGYWVSRRSHRQRVEEAGATDEAARQRAIEAFGAPRSAAEPTPRTAANLSDDDANSFPR